MEALREELRRYPSSFNVLETIGAVSDAVKIKIRDKLLSELCSVLKEFSTSMEKVRVWNLLSCLYFVLGDRTRANKYNCEALHESPNNIVALTNNAWFSFKDRKNLRVCDVTLKRLRTLKSDKLGNTVAKAEVAFAFSRFGMKQYHHAISLFSEVKKDIDDIIEKRTQASSHNSPNDDTFKAHDTLMELKCVWTYGYAMTLQRLLHVSYSNEEEDIDVIRKRHCSVFKLYGEIVGLPDESECMQRYKARTFVEAGLLAYGVEKNKSLFPSGMKGLLPKHSVIYMPTYKYFESALELFPNDVFVLERSGKYFRYIDDIERSILLLSKAIEVKGTSFGYHHLALSYIRLLEYNPTKQRHLLETINEASKQNMLSVKQPASNPTFISHPGREKIDKHGGDSTPLTELAECSDTDNNQLQPLPIENSAALRETNSSSFDKSSLCAETEKDQLLKSNKQTTAHTQQRQCTNKNRQGLMNPMAKPFVPQEQTKLKENAPSQQTRTKSNYLRPELKHEPRFDNRRVYTNNTSRFHVPIENAYAFRQNESYLYGNSRRTHTRFDYTEERKRFYGNNERCQKNDEGERNVNFYQKKHSNSSQFRHRYMPQSKQQPTRAKLGFPVKCFRFPKQIDYDKCKDLIDIVISHLDKSVNLSSNMAALYDKAVLFRQIKQNDKALEVFESLMQNNDNLCTNVMLANSYEQAAFCISDILDGPDKVDQETVQQLSEDRLIYLKTSVEMACNIVSKYPYLGSCWSSAQTLRQILLSKSKTKRTKETLNDLWFLYNKLNNHSEVISVLEELKALAEDDAEKEDIIEKIVLRYLCVHNYEEAVIALCMLNRLNGISIDKSLYVQVYVEAGLDAFRRKHFDKARLRIRKAFSTDEDDNTNVSSSTEKADERYDLFILSNLDDEGPGRNLMVMLNDLGLHTTFNTDSSSILPGTPEVDGMTKVMSMSKAFVIIMNFDIEDKKLQHLVDRMQVIIEERTEKSLIMVIANSTTEFPSACRFSTYDRIDLDLECISENGNEDMFEGVKQLLVKLASV